MRGNDSWSQLPRRGSAFRSPEAPAGNYPRNESGYRIRFDEERSGSGEEHGRTNRANSRPSTDFRIFGSGTVRYTLGMRADRGDSRITRRPGQVASQIPERPTEILPGINGLIPLSGGRTRRSEAYGDETSQFQRQGICPNVLG